MKQPSLKDTPLNVEVKDRQLTIRIGIDTLAFAFEHQPDNEEYDEAAGKVYSKYKVTHPAKFAQDVIHAMEVEEEDGSSPLNNFLDKVCQYAVDEGSEWVEYPMLPTKQKSKR